MKKFLTVIFSVAMVIAFANFVSAAVPNLQFGGNLYFRLEDGAGNDIRNTSKLDFYKLEVSTQRRFGANGMAYIGLEAHSGTNGRWQIQKYGYDYIFSSKLGAAVLYEVDGIPLSDGELGSNWDWLRVGAFNQKNILNLNGRPFKGTNVHCYLEPEKMEYLLKGEYSTGALRVGAGYSNVEAIVNNDRYFNIYGELSLRKNSRIYVDYLSDGQFLIDTSVTLDPVTLAVLYSNENKTQYGYEVFAADTMDFSVAYALSGRTAVTGGLVYDAVDAGIGHVYGEYGFGQNYAGVDYNLPDAEFELYGGYALDGVNTLQGAYNLTTGAWKLVMAIELW